MTRITGIMEITREKLMTYTRLSALSYEREVPSMSKANSLKNGKMSEIHFLITSRSPNFNQENK